MRRFFKKYRTLLLILVSIFLVVFVFLIYFYESNNSRNLLNGKCKKGYVDYGIPLGCITVQQNEECAKTLCPICLSSKTKIATNNGQKVVTELKTGDLVWSQDKSGNRVLVPIQATSNRQVPLGTKLLAFTLADGRHILISPSHPTSSGELFSDIRVGQLLDGVKVDKITNVDYNDGYTYDILPRSDAGTYWANDILVGSTLKKL